jgi:hypothetical protein
MSNSPSVHTGGCLCGAVRYRVAGPLRPVVMCHCTQCRRTTGHVMAATAARRADFSLVSEGELKWYVSSAEARRGFCGRCGSTLFWEGVGLDRISIAAGTLDDTRGLKIACHIFVADKGEYYEIEPGAQQIRDGRFSVPFADS